MSVTVGKFVEDVVPTRPDVCWVVTTAIADVGTAASDVATVPVLAGSPPAAVTVAVGTDILATD